MIAGILLSGRCLFVVVVGERKEEGGKERGGRTKGGSARLPESRDAFADALLPKVALIDLVGSKNHLSPAFSPPLHLLCPSDRL